MSYNDYCEDCIAYGDDYYMNDEGEYECRCTSCAFNDNDDEYND
jgi:hypothetical protein